jgi:hypothetical protein
MSYQMKKKEIPKVFFHFESKSRLEPGGPLSVLPSHNESTLVFLLEQGKFAIYHEAEGRWTRSKIEKPWEPMPPLLMKDRFLAWSKKGLHGISFQGKEQGLLHLKGYGVSLLIHHHQQLWLGSTRQELHLLQGPELTSQPFSVSGVPFIFFEDVSQLGTSHGVIYDLSDSTPREILPHRSETLSFFPFGDQYCFLSMDYRLYLDDYQSRRLMVSLNQDFMLPFLRGNHCYLVDRDRRLCSMDSEGKLEILREFALSPLWYKHQGDYSLLVFEKGKTVEIVLLGFDEGGITLHSFEAEGLFEPLGISDSSLYFSLGAGNWYIWQFGEPEPTAQNSIPPTQVLCFGSSLLVRQGKHWVNSGEERIEIPDLEVKDINYDYQNLGILPLS